jgi:hypothetical protein
VDKKASRREKSLPQKCINSFLAHKLSHYRLFWFFFLGAYGSLPDAAIWWCLRTGGGGVRSRSRREEMMQKLSQQEKEEINRLPKEDLHRLKSGMLYTKDIDYYMDS